MKKLMNTVATEGREGRGRFGGSVRKSLFFQLGIRDLMKD